MGAFGDGAAWSFCQDKILSTAGEGGMVTTSRADLWDATGIRLGDLRSSTDALLVYPYHPGLTVWAGYVGFGI